MMKRYLIEFIGTFFIVLTVALTGNPLAIGAIFVAMIYMGGPISGAHFNPAVTLAIFLRGAIKGHEAWLYAASQLAAAFVAAAVYYLVKGSVFLAQPGPDSNFAQSALLEVLFTFALATVVLYTASSKLSKGNQYYGLAIGFVILAGAYSAGTISGGVFNPAIGVGPILFDLSNIGSHLSWLLLYTLAPLAGGALAALLYHEAEVEA